MPARNEAHQIEDAIRFLSAEMNTHDEVIVVDDDSSDETASIASAAGARVVRVGGVPDGWLGKPHACWKGAEVAVHDTLVFLDADVRVRDRALDAAAEIVRNDRGSLVSVQPFHTPKRWGEHAALPFNVVSMLASGAGWRSRGALAFGPVMVCDASRYRAVGGHSAISVRGAVNEDIALGRLFDHTRVYLGGPKSVTFRMYPHGLKSLVNGFSKNLATGAASATTLPLMAAVAWVAAQVGVMFTSPALYLLAVVQMWWMGRRVGRFSLLDAVIYPLYLVVFVGVFARSVMVGLGLARVEWAGRRVR